MSQPENPRPSERRDVTLTEKLDIVADALKELSRAVSKLSVHYRSEDAHEAVKLEVARVATMVNVIRSNVSAGLKTGHR